MLRRLRQQPYLLLALLLVFAYLYGLGRFGLIGPDEPRYAWIGRAMAESGDWITPRLWGQPWFEKPPLLYWLIGLGYQLGGNDNSAPRLPVALFSLLTLACGVALLRKLLPAELAWRTVFLLACSAGWFAFSQAAATDLPLAACYFLSVVLWLCWQHTQQARWLVASGAALGLAMLAKGLVPVVLCLPLLFWMWRRPLDVLRYGLSAALVAAPWYALCYARNGQVFIDEFIVKHHLQRFTSDSLQHVQPGWFYVPVLLVACFPWLPMLAQLRQPSAWERSTERPLWACLLFGFLFFSASRNKLPGYVLPLLPLLAVLVGARLRQVQMSAFAASVILLALLPWGASLLAPALSQGLSHVETFASPVPWLLLGGVGAVALTRWARESQALALSVMYAATFCAMLFLKSYVGPVLDQDASTRRFYQQHKRLFEQSVCIEQIHRNAHYGLNFYARQPLPSCAEAQHGIWQVRGTPDGRLEVVSLPAAKPHVR